MSEEKPTFKITDRRLFNADGSARDVEREEEPAVTSSVVSNIIGTPASASAPASATASASSPAGAQQRQQESSGAATTNTMTARGDAANTMTARGDAALPSSPASPSQSATAPDVFESELEQSPAEAGDPTAFVNLIMFIAQPAAVALGMTDHPTAGINDIDLPLAKHCIDLLAELKQKTTGNLSAQEQQIFEGLLTELRMGYVAVANQRPTMPSPGGFSGSDITGGR